MVDSTLARMRDGAAPCDARPVDGAAVVHRGGDGRRLAATAPSVPVALHIGSLPGATVEADAGKRPPRSHVAARRAVLEWQRVKHCLAPIIGSAGLEASLERIVAVSRDLFPWLPVARRSTSGRIDWTPPYLALAGQPGLESSSADAALQQAFGDLMTSLVGGRLARALLAPPKDVGDVGSAALECSA